MPEKIGFAIIFFLFAVFAETASAAVGISPPAIATQIARPGERYRQTFHILRSDADREETARISLFAPDISDWITFDKGENIVLPAGELRTPVTIFFDVPQNAAIGEYNGKMEIGIASKQSAAEGIAVATGAQADIRLQLTNFIIPDFKVKNVRVPEYAIRSGLAARWPFKYFTQKLTAYLDIANTGNVAIAPDRVDLEVYDIAGQDVLFRRASAKLSKIEAFADGTIPVEFGLDLEKGEYWAGIKVYKGGALAFNNRIAFSTKAGDDKRLNLILGASILLPIIVLFFILILAIIIRKKKEKGDFK